MKTTKKQIGGQAVNVPPNRKATPPCIGLNKSSTKLTGKFKKSADKEKNTGVLPCTPTQPFVQHLAQQILTCTELDVDDFEADFQGFKDGHKPLSFSPKPPRFRVVAKVQDQTGSVVLFMFDEIMRALLHASASQVVARRRRLLRAGPPGDVSVPPELMALLGKEFVFKLRMGNYNVIGGFQNYPVSGVFTPVASWEIDYAGALSAQASDAAGPSPAHRGTIPGVNRSGKRKLVLTDGGDGGSDDDIGIECFADTASQ